MPGERLPAKHVDFQNGSGSPYGNNALGIVTVMATNKSGGALSRGQIVTYDTTSNSTKDVLACTTTTSGNDVKAMGVVFDQSIASGAIGRIQIFGPHDSIKVNGTTAISAGDKIGAFTSAGIGQKNTGVTGVIGTFNGAYAVADSLGTIAGFISRLDFARQV